MDKNKKQEQRPFMTSRLMWYSVDHCQICPVKDCWSRWRSEMYTTASDTPWGQAGGDASQGHGGGAEQTAVGGGESSWRPADEDRDCDTVPGEGERWVSAPGRGKGWPLDSLKVDPTVPEGCPAHTPWKLAPQSLKVGSLTPLHCTLYRVYPLTS